VAVETRWSWWALLAAGAVFACSDGGTAPSGPDATRKSTTVPTAGLVAYYPFDGNADDVSGKASNGIVSGATLTTDRFGVANHAYSFDGVSANITTTTKKFAQSSQLSVSVWVMLPDIPSGGAFMGASEFGVTSSGNGLIGLSIYHPHTNTAFGVGLSDTWVHFVGTFDGHDIRAYTNGQLVDWLSWPGALSDADRPLVVGQFLTQHWQGSLDDVRIYNRALSPDEVQQLYHEGGWSPPSSLPLPPAPTAARDLSITYVISGTATSDDGAPVANAQVLALFSPAQGPSLDSLGQRVCNCQLFATTDAGGHYSMKVAVDQPASIGMQLFAGDAYEEENQVMTPVGSGAAQTMSFHAHRMSQIAAGDSMLVTVDPTNSACFNGLQPVGGWPINEPRCRTILVMPAANGVLHVDAISTHGGANAGLEIEDAALQNENLGNPASVKVTAGKYVRVNVEIPNNSDSQTFMVHTSLTPP
jgi:hypothetical protein